MKKKIELLLKNIHEHGLKLTMIKVLTKQFGKCFFDLQKKNIFIEQKQFISTIDISSDDLHLNSAVLNNHENINVQVKVVNWLLPNFDHVLYGGIYTILRAIAFFQEKGVKNRIIIYDNPFVNVQKVKKIVEGAFPSLDGVEVVAFSGKIDDMLESDAVVSTFWTSCYLSAKSNKTKKKYYFIQDYEPLFYSANSYYALAEATYRLGFKGIVNTPGLADFVRNQHDMECQEFYPCIDHNIYNITDEQLEKKIKNDIVNIFVYGRPNHDRNAFEVALIVLKKIKEKYGDRVNIYSAGDSWNEKDYGVEGVIKNLGRLDSLEKVADLYRKCDIGLVFMFTKHPSYQPFEYMSCGCAVVTNYNKSNLWFLKDKHNALLSEPMPSCVVDKISNLIEDKKLRRKIVMNGLKEVTKHSWDEECDKIYQYVVQNKKL